MSFPQVDIDRVAVIGAGPGGLAATKYLVAEKKFSKIEVFEQRSAVGGVWNYSALNVVDSTFTVPRTQPSKIPDEAIWTEGSSNVQFVSPVYDFLETNIPHTLMNYSDQPFPKGSSLFPKHARVEEYLQTYAEELKDLIKLETQVLNVVKVKGQVEGKSHWAVTVRDLKTGIDTTSEFDAVVIANGHYNDPFIPDIKGIAEFSQKYPGIVSHSKFYKRPDHYKDKKVVIVGYSASGIDLSSQISTVCQQPILISEKVKGDTPVEERPWAKMVPEISEFLPEERAVRFSNGEVEKDIDAVVFCTGYFYSFPFLSSLEPKVVTDGSYARNLYQHVFYINDPTLAFIGIPQRVVPFPISEAQGGYIARFWAGRIKIHSISSMQAWEASLISARGDSKLLHNLAFPKDVDYINGLYEASMAATKVPGLDNDGAGKIPPYWGPDKQWYRERFPLIKIASRKLGDKRHQVTTLAELGFDYDSWKAESEK